MTSFDFMIDSAHPSIPGHFPGNPIVPGAVIIENVIEAFCKLDCSKKVTSLSTVKFLKPIATKQKVIVNFRSISTELISFECTSSDEISVVGRFKIK